MHSRLRLIQVPFCGVSEARDIAIRSARGEYIAILDSDDVARRERLTRQVAELERSSKVVGVACRTIERNEVSGRSRVIRYSSHSGTLRLLLEAGVFPIAHSALAFRRSHYMAIGGYSQQMEMAEDFDFLLRLSRMGKLLSLREPLAVITHRLSSHTHTHRPKGRDDHYYVVYSLLLNTSRQLRASALLDWLDGVGRSSIEALLSRWSLGLLLRHGWHLEPPIAEELMKRGLRNLKSMGVARRLDWWQHAESPLSLAHHLRRSFGMS